MAWPLIVIFTAFVAAYFFVSPDPIRLFHQVPPAGLFARLGQGGGP